MKQSRAEGRIYRSFVLFPGAVDYLRIFRRHVGRRLYVIFALSALMSLTEGLGITLIVPLLASLDVGNQEAVGDIPGIGRLVSFLGVAGSAPGIVALIVIVFGIKALFKFTGTVYSGHLVIRLAETLKRRIFDACTGVQYEYFARQSAGHLINLIIGQVNDFFRSLNAYLTFLAGVLQAGTYLSLALVLSWKFGAMAIGLGLLVWLGLRSLNERVRMLSRKTSIESSHLNRYLVQALQSFKYLASTNTLNRLSQNVRRSLDRLTKYRQKQAYWAALSGSISEPVSVFFIAGIILIQLLVLHEPLAPILVALILFHRGLGVMLSVQGRWQSVCATIGSVEMVETELASIRSSREVDGTRAMAAFAHSIELKGVTFRYAGMEAPALADVSLAIPARETVALVGASGAGKSTLVDLLTLMLRPSRGEVVIDGLDGNDIVRGSWRSQIGFVSQDTVVFDDTIAANIALQDVGMDSPTKLLERIRTAAMRAHIHDFVETLPDRYLTQVGERGIRLSGGQRQRLFIARELFKEPKLLILDEATSALDSASERCIEESINALKGSMTVVMIAHRLATIRNADRIFVLEEGRLVEEGTYDELLSRPVSRFRRMVELQSLSTEADAWAIEVARNG